MAQGLVFFEGASASSLDVRILDEGNLGAPGALLLQGITVLPIEITGRKASQELDGAIARVDVRQDLPRVELPEIGSLFAYSRQAGAFHGFLFAPLMGGARVLLELPGGTGGASPFADRIAVARDGVHAILPELGGAVLHLVRLDGGTFADGTSARTVTIAGGSDNTGLMVGATVAFATANDRILRLPLAAGDAVDLTPPLAVARPRLKPELAMSGDGTKVVFLYGASNLTLQLYLLDDASPAAQLLPPPPNKYEEPGYLPEGTGDMRLLLNEDGSRLMFMNPERAPTGGGSGGSGGGGGGGDESSVLDTTGVLPTLQVTDDVHFQPWVGIHILPSFYGAKLLVAIGDINAMDWFQAELDAQGGTVVNLTVTGSPLPPFGPGALIPSKVKAVGNYALATNVATTSTLALRKIDLATGATQVLAQDLPADLETGVALGAQPDVFVPGPGDSILSGQTGALIGRTPPGVRLTPPLTMPLCGVTSVEILPGWFVVTFYLQTGDVVFGPMVQGLKQMVLTPGGGLLVSHAGGLLYLALGQPMLPVPLPDPGVRVFVTGANG